MFGSEDAIAYITAKESVSNGHRVYSLELTEIEKLRDKGNTLEAQGDQRATHGASIDKVANLLAEVKSSTPNPRYSVTAQGSIPKGKTVFGIINSSDDIESQTAPGSVGHDIWRKRTSAWLYPDRVLWWTNWRPPSPIPSGACGLAAKPVSRLPASARGSLTRRKKRLEGSAR
jgi:hypothetical protein